MQNFSEGFFHALPVMKVAKLSFDNLNCWFWSRSVLFFTLFLRPRPFEFAPEEQLFRQLSNQIKVNLTGSCFEHPLSISHP